MDKKLSVLKISENAWTKRKWHGKCDLEHGSETVLRRLVDRPVFRYHPFLHQKVQTNLERLQSLTIHISVFDVRPGHGTSDNVRQSSDRVADRPIARLW